MKTKKSNLGNPLAVVAGAKVVEKSAEAIPFLIKLFTVLGVAYYAYSKYTNRFVKRKENSAYSAANLSYAQAKSRADAIYGSISTFSNDFENVSRQIAGLNYNGFVRVFNAFEHKKGTLFGGDLNLEEWCYNQFTNYQMQQLSFLLGGAFFQ
ncbi:hypothetical protein SAMN05443667_101251 [Flavobacterium gillisiae]|uniref:Uncharacterized protein n=1 Tax=Flavobacterium gillisiae TaxID=150146 RepID=A0A1H3WWV6_9FLAO|nr:hypothetical protein [Flavobacterium gillisiae]SDZ90854.1 hypothetical protein SAMN05443667_101251 [Flavobacterium gillisiae]